MSEELPTVSQDLVRQVVASIVNSDAFQPIMEQIGRQAVDLFGDALVEHPVISRAILERIRQSVHLSGDGALAVHGVAWETSLEIHDTATITSVAGVVEHDIAMAINPERHVHREQGRGISRAITAEQAAVIAGLWFGFQSTLSDFMDNPSRAALSSAATTCIIIAVLIVLMSSSDNR